MPLAPEWQHPFVNVFKICDVDTMKEFETKGDVTEHMDKIIGKKVFKVRGVIPAGNYLRVPRTKLQTLGLTGRFLYVQLKVTPIKVFVIHIEAVTEDQNIHRISISNMYSQDTLKRKSNGVQLAFPRASHRWCVLAVDLRTALAGFTSSPFASIRSIQMCSWLTVRTMFTSDYRFSLESLPSDMALSHALDTGVFEMVWLPREPQDAPTMDFMPPPKRISSARRRTADSSNTAAAAATTTAAASTGRPTHPVRTSISGRNPQLTTSARGSGKAGAGAAVGRNSSTGSAGGAGATAGTSKGGKDLAGASGQRGDGRQVTDQQLREEGDGLSSEDEAGVRGTVPPPSPLPLSPGSAAAAARCATAANVSAGTTAGAVVTAAAVPSRPGDPFPAGFPRRTPALPIPSTAAPSGTAITTRRRAVSASTGTSGAAGVTIAAATVGVESVVQGPPLTPDPALELVRMNAYSGEFVRCLVWIPGSDEVAFAAASVVVLMSVADVSAAAVPSLQSPLKAPNVATVEPGRQRYLLGHTAFVCALAAASNGEVVVSAQEGKEAIVRLWDVASCACLAILNAHASGLSCVDISPDVRAVAAVGLDAHARQTIALWNIAEMRNPLRKIELVTRHATEFNIKVLRFSAYQEDHLLTAGRDSIRIYRLKAGQLRGTSVRLVPQEKRVTSHIGGVSAALGPNVFTDIAFEAGVGVYGADAFKVYVSSASGAVFQVDYTTRQLDCVYQLHSGPINVLLVADGLAITGADDRLLRAWPLDFKDYLLEAEHEGSVTGLALSPDALRVAIGTENGALGCLHIPNHAYTTLLRSHSAAVNAVAVDPNRDQYCTVSSDGTLRIWHLLTHQQLYEFDAPGEAVTCIAYHPLPAHHELAAGFANGRMRVFDVATTTLIQEQQQHRAAVAELVFAPSGDRLFSGGMDGALVMYDVQRLYAPTQYLSAGVRDIKVCVAVSPDGSYFASLLRDPYRGVTSLLLFHGRSLDPFMRIETDAEGYVKLAFSPNSQELWALTSGRRLDRYELTDGHLVQQISEVSPLDLTTLAMDPVGRYVLTAGNDGLIRLWGCVPLAALQPRGLPPHQAFLGHPSTVLGAAFHRGHVITVGDADCVCVWRITADFLAHPHLHAAQAVRAAAARRLSALPPPLRPPDAPSPPAASSPPWIPTAIATPTGPAYAYTLSPAASAVLDPHDPRSRVTPATALGPVADAADHGLTTRAAALGLAPVPPGTLLVSAPAVPLAWPPAPGGTAGAPQQPQQLYYVATQPQAGASMVVPASPPAAAAFNAVTAAFAAARVSSPQQPTFAPRPVPVPAPQSPHATLQPPQQHPQQHPQQQPDSPYGGGPGMARQSMTLSPQQPRRLTPPPPPHPPSPSSYPHPQQPSSPPSQQRQQPHSPSHQHAQQQQQPFPMYQSPSPLAPQAPLPPPACDWLLGYTPTGCSNAAWRPETGVFAYVVEDMVVLEHLATRHQRYLRGHSRPLACLAASPDGAAVAAAPAAAEPYAVEPSSEAATLAVPCATAPFADVVVWEAASGRERWRLRYHTKGVQALTFSPDGRWLLSLGREPERSVVVWDVCAGQLVAAGRTEQLPLAADWLWGGDHPVFATVGPEGLNLWTLQDSFLEQRSVPLSDNDTAVPCTALTVDPAGALLVAEAPSVMFADGGSGAASKAPPHVVIWHVEVAGALAGGTATMAQVASLPGDMAVTCMAAGHSYALLGTDQGHVMRFRRSTLSGTWSDDSSVRLDGRVLSLSAEPGMGDAVVATATSTIWFVGMEDASTVPIVCGQPAPVQALVPAPHDPRVMASTSQDGLLRMWRLGPEDAEPIVELQSSAACTAASFVLRVSTSPDPLFTSPQPSTSSRQRPSLAQPQEQPAADSGTSASSLQPLLLGGYTDGSLRLFALEPAVELQWALARHPAPVVGVVPHPVKPLALTASSDGSIAITDLSSTRLVSYITVFTTLGPHSNSTASKQQQQQQPASPSLSSSKSPSKARGTATTTASASRRSPRSPSLAATSPAQQQQAPLMPRPGTGPMQAFAVSPGAGASVAAAGWRDRFVVFPAPWDDPTCTPISAYDCRPSDSRSGPADSTHVPPGVSALLSFVGGATKLLTYASPLLPGAVLVYDYRLGVVVRRVTIPQMIRSMALSPDGSALVLGSSERSVFLVHLGSGNHRELGGHTGPVVAAAFSGDGSHAVTAAGNVLMVWGAEVVTRDLTPPPPPPPRRTLFEF